MKNRFGSFTLIFGWAMALALGAFVSYAWAGDSSFFTRQTWDLILRWINFIILATVCVKYGRKPILQFLDNQKAGITRSLNDLEEQKKQAEMLVAESQRQLVDSRDRLVQIRERIVTDGQNRKNQIVADAQNEARIMIDAAQSRIAGQLKMAYSEIRAELVDIATDLALSNLPKIVTAEDQNQWLDHWFASTQE